jgi:hypothetical protein
MREAGLAVEFPFVVIALEGIDHIPHLLTFNLAYPLFMLYLYLNMLSFLL